ncbi:hypothetical protein [Spongiimicrobium salis]|uniref:hypothetical protein n=1 Tax=Spongiimicrobium salis TaxID=1667022 RepID=UPI00374D3206
MKKLMILLLLISLSGCGGAKLLPKESNTRTTVKDSVWTQRQVIDTVVVARERDTVGLMELLDKLSERPVIRRSGSATLTLQRKGDSISATCECKELKAAVQIYKDIINRMTERNTETEITNTLERNRMPGWAKPFLWLGIAVATGAFGLAIFYIIIRRRRK